MKPPSQGLRAPGFSRHQRRPCTLSEAPGSSAKMHVLGPHTLPNPGTTLPSAEPKSSDRTPLLLRPSPTQRGRGPAAQPPHLCSDQVRHQPRQPPRSCPSLNAHPSSGPCLAAASIWNVPPWAASLTCPRSPGRHAGPWREEAYAMLRDNSTLLSVLWDNPFREHL